MRALWVILTFVVAAQPVLAQNARALRAAAERALNKERFCDAAFLYAKLDDQEPGGDALALAGEAAERSNDRARAVAFYKSFIGKAPKHPRVRAAERSIAALEKLMSASGNGQVCGAAPPPECGNGLVEGAESCDDGNTTDGDKCSRTCGGGGYTAAPTPLPVPTAVPVPVPLPAPPPPAPVVAAPAPAPVVAPPPPPPKATPTPAPAPTPAPTPAPVPADGELCTLIKAVKVFSKGEWKTLDFGSTVTIKSKGAEFTKVETAGGEAKVATASLEGACAKEGGAVKPEPAPASKPEPLAFDDPETGGTDGATETTEPAPAPAVTEEDPDLKAEHDKEIETKRIEPLADERKPASEAPEVEEGGGGGIGGWLTMGAGAAILAGGATVAVWGFLPYLDNRGQCGASPVSMNGCPALDNLAGDYTRADNDEDRAAAADDADRLKTRIDNAAQQWDSQGRWLLTGGAVAAGLGLGVAVTGLIIALASGGEEEEQ